MDFLVSSANISFSVKLPRPTQLAHPAKLAHPAQPAHTAQLACCVMGIRFHGYLDITDIRNLLISWVSDFTDIWISWIS